MKILTLHCDYLKFKPLKKAIKNPEELSKERGEEKKIEEVLAVFTAVEKNDETNPKVVNDLIVNIKDIAKQVGTKNIVLYPYAHLSSNLSNPLFAQKVLEQAEEQLKKERYNADRAPFGYYKEFELKCKGHPLSELSREIKLETDDDKLQKEVKFKKIEKEEVYDYKKILSQLSKTKLDTSKLKENDHRIVGQKLDLFSFSEVAPGMVFWHNNGLIIYNELINYWRDEHRKAGYQEISTPQILDKRLWLISGHWDKYKENIFLTEYEGRDFAVKPMNCPGGMLVYKNSPKSYKDLPLRVGELGIVHRQELSGVLGGLFRVIKFTQDDAHIFCTEEQLEDEIINIIEIIDTFFKKFDLKFDHVELSTRPEKRIGDDKVWDKAENTLENVLKKRKINYKINKGDGAFYGPKIDFHAKDSQGRTWQLSTIQLDFAMPERFELEYTDTDNKKRAPIMLHRVVYGSMERFIGILLEHTNGALPTWLSPIQVRVINFTDRNNKACEKLVKKLKESNIRVDFDFNSVPLAGKIREAEMQKIPYVIVIGDKEEKERKIAVRVRGEKKIFSESEDKFIQKIKGEIDNRLK
ncbi:MAG TPA: threonine--tRNA ligase [Candidatus Paceibacterota bacterium]|nr:threonine--tRNA ligase [Candidatus Paceibacterota bacterium]